MSDVLNRSSFLARSNSWTSRTHVVKAASAPHKHLGRSGAIRAVVALVDIHSRNVAVLKDRFGAAVICKRDCCAVSVPMPPPRPRKENLRAILQGLGGLERLPESGGYGSQRRSRMNGPFARIYYLQCIRYRLGT